MANVKINNAPRKVWGIGEYHGGQSNKSLCVPVLCAVNINSSPFIL